MKKTIVAGFLSLTLTASIVSTADAEFELNEKTKLSPKALTAMFSGKIRTCEPDSRNFVFKFFKDGKVDASNNRGGDTGTWKVNSGGKLCVTYDGRWKDWCRDFYLSPTNPNQVGYRGTGSGRFYTCTLKPID